MLYIIISNMFCIIEVLYTSVIYQRYIGVPFCLLDVLYNSAR